MLVKDSERLSVTVLILLFRFSLTTYLYAMIYVKYLPSITESCPLQPINETTVRDFG